MPTIYIDMDGVVADFNEGARRAIRATHEDRAVADENAHWPDHLWNSLRDVPNLYRHLPKMKQADELMDLAMRFRDTLGWNLRMLTAIPHNNDMHDVFYDKFLWMQDYYPGIRVDFGPYSVDKHKHCQAGDILVDDRRSNCEEWRAAGGTAVRVTSDYNLALKELREIFDDLLMDKDSSQSQDLS